MTIGHITSQHVGGCNSLCVDGFHYLLPDWATRAEWDSAIAESSRAVALSRLACAEAKWVLGDRGPL